MLPTHYQRLVNRLADIERELIWNEWCNAIPIGVGQPTRLFVDCVCSLYPRWTRKTATLMTSALLRHYLEPEVSDLVKFGHGRYGWKLND